MSIPINITGLSEKGCSDTVQGIPPVLAHIYINSLLQILRKPLPHIVLVSIT